jgi:hypothetical protein
VIRPLRRQARSRPARDRSSVPGPVGAALGGLALAGAGYFALGLCTLTLPLVSAILVSFRCLGAAEGAR